MRPKFSLLKLIKLFLILLSSFTAVAQNPPPQVKASPPTDLSKKEIVNELEIQPYREVYRRFHENYKLGANDEIAIRIVGQPEYSIEKTKISPVGRIFHPLLGEVEVAGRTVPQLIEELTKDLSEYLLNPKISVSLLETRSAKVGVLGEVLRPGILIMNEPMKILDAIKEAGGLTEYGNKSSVIVYRQENDGRIGTHEVNLKKILEGKSSNSENLELQPGDTVMVTGNIRKKVAFVASLTSIGSFMTYINRGR
jgi:protein involved in polysaccharide export with SLBB domain